MYASNSSTPEPSKKRRVEDAPCSPVIVRSSQFWLEDGTIIIQAGTTQFRVYRGLLSRHSTIFNDMFKISQPTGQLLVEGCPVVVVYDREMDWLNLLSVLHNINDHRIPLVPILISMLRLGHKYEFGRIRSLAAQSIIRLFPSTLSVWDEDDPYRSFKLIPSESAGFEFELINVLHETGVHKAIPAAYLRCLSDQGLENILKGVKLPDNTPSSLPHAIQVTLALARDRLSMIALHHYVTNPLALFDKDLCTQPTKCSARRVEVATRRTAQILRTFPDDGGADEGFCTYCQMTISAHTFEGRRILWDRLPSVFGLPDWATLGDTVA